MGYGVFRRRPRNTRPLRRRWVSTGTAALAPPTDLVLGFISDSLWALTNAYGTRDTPTVIGHLLEKTGAIRSVAIVNRAESGTATGDWVHTAGRYVTAKSDFLAASVTHVLYRLGANDASASVSATTYDSNMADTINDLVAAGLKVILCYPPYRADDPGYPAFLAAYQAKIDARINGGTILRGDVLAYDWFANHTSELDGSPGSGVHPGVLGSESDAAMIAWAVWNLIYRVSTSPVATLRLVQNIGTY